MYTILRKSLFIICILFIFGMPTKVFGQSQVLIKGVVWDGEVNAAMPFASISVKSLKNNEFDGVNSNIDGFFSLSLVPGLYEVKVSFVGYLDYILDTIRLSDNLKTLNLGRIVLKPNYNLIEGAEVSGQKAEMIMDVDKKIFNVENNAITAGGTAIDVLGQLPTIDIDVDGNVTLRGSTDVLIYINGKQSGLSGTNPQAILQQIPAANIERVEIMNNPSAKYDAEGTSGIINIILKKSTKDGWNALLVGGAGTNYKYNGSASFSYNKKKTKLSLTYGFRDNMNWSKGTTYRYNYFADTSFYLDQESYRDRRSINHTLNGSLDFDLSKAAILSFNWLAGINVRSGEEDVWFSFLNEQEVLNARYLRAAREDRSSLSGEFGVNFTRLFKGEGHNLVFITTISSSDQLENSVFNQDLSGPFRQNQRTDNGTQNILPIVQIDYTLPLANDKVFEAGTKQTLRAIDDFFYSDTMNYQSEAMDPHNGLINNFLYNELVNAAYLNYSMPFKGVKIKGGVRVEQTLISGEQKVGNVEIKNSYTHFFPSFFISKQLKKGHDLQAGYSRRIKRPGLRTLNPFAEQTDPFNLRVGNPGLNPELIDAIEMTYFASQKGNFFSGTLYYRQVNGVTQRVRSVNTEGIAVMTWFNLDVSQNLGLESILRRKFKHWNGTLNLNMFRDQVSGSALNTNLAVVNYSWFGKFLASAKLSKKVDIQGSYFYRGRITYVQGEIAPMHGLDLGFKWSVLHNNGTFTLNITDVFNTKQFAIQNSGLNFESDMVRKWETRILTFTFSYKLGNLNVDWEKRNRRSMGGGEDMDF